VNIAITAESFDGIVNANALEDAVATVRVSIMAGVMFEEGKAIPVPDERFGATIFPGPADAAEPIYHFMSKKELDAIIADAGGSSHVIVFAVVCAIYRFVGGGGCTLNVYGVDRILWDGDVGPEERVDSSGPALSANNPRLRPIPLHNSAT